MRARVSLVAPFTSVVHAGQYVPTAVDLEAAAVVDSTNRPVFLLWGRITPIYVVDDEPFPRVRRAS